MRHPATLRTKSRTHVVTRESYGWHVTSGTTGNVYTVWQSGKDTYLCSCDWAKYRPAEGSGACGCSHVIAVIDHITTQAARTTQVLTDPEPARRNHRKVLNIGDGLIISTRSK